MTQESIVIAVSAISGGGKSTVVRKLTEQLKDSVAIYFDDYATAETYPIDFDAWAATGYNLNELNSPLLVQHLAALKAGKSVASPVDGKVMAPEKYIVFEAPLGRAHKDTGQYIDYLAYIDTPLELGFARMVKRTAALSTDHNKSRDELAGQIHQVTDMVESYVKWTRHAYIMQRNQVMPDSDLTVDGSGSIEDITKTVVDGLISSGLFN